MNLSLPEFIFSSAGLWRLFICAAFFLRPIFPAFDALGRLAFCYLRKFAPAGGAKAIFAFIFLRADSLDLRTKSAGNKKKRPAFRRVAFRQFAFFHPHPRPLSSRNRFLSAAAEIVRAAKAAAKAFGKPLKSRHARARPAVRDAHWDAHSERAHTAGYESLTCSQAPSFALLLSAASIKARPILPSSTVA